MPFAKMDFEVLTDARLSAGAKLFYAHLQRWDWGGGCWLTDRQLAREIGVSTRTVRNHTKALEEAGCLWVFEDREGLTVRLVVRAGHVYPAPRGLGKPLPKSGKKLSRPFKVYIETDEFEVPPQNNTEEIPDPVPPEPVLQPVVVSPEPTNQAEEPAAEPEADQVPEADPQPERLPAVAAPEALPEAALTAVALLADAGVARGAARKLALAHPVRQIRAAVAYVRGYRSEVLNPAGLVRWLLESGSKIPGWAYRSKDAQGTAGRAETPQEGRSTPRATTGPQELDAAYWARYRGETMGYVDPLDGRTWAEIREGLTEDERRYCEAEG